MNLVLLREYIRGVIAEDSCEGKKTTLSAQNRDDLGIAIHWAKLHGAVKNARGGCESCEDGRHRVKVSHRGSKKDFKALIKDRFGSFVDVE